MTPLPRAIRQDGHTSGEFSKARKASAGSRPGSGMVRKSRPGSTMSRTSASSFLPHSFQRAPVRPGSSSFAGTDRGSERPTVLPLQSLNRTLTTQAFKQEDYKVRHFKQKCRKRECPHCKVTEQLDWFEFKLNGGKDASYRYIQDRVSTDIDREIEEEAEEAKRVAAEKAEQEAEQELERQREADHLAAMAALSGEDPESSAIPPTPSPLRPRSRGKRPISQGGRARRLIYSSGGMSQRPMSAAGATLGGGLPPRPSTSPAPSRTLTLSTAASGAADTWLNTSNQALGGVLGNLTSPTSTAGTKRKEVVTTENRKYRRMRSVLKEEQRKLEKVEDDSEFGRPHQPPHSKEFLVHCTELREIRAQFDLQTLTSASTDTLVDAFLQVPQINLDLRNVPTPGIDCFDDGVSQQDFNAVLYNCFPSMSQGERDALFAVFRRGMSHTISAWTVMMALEYLTRSVAEGDEFAFLKFFYDCMSLAETPALQQKDGLPTFDLLDLRTIECVVKRRPAQDRSRMNRVMNAFTTVLIEPLTHKPGALDASTSDPTNAERATIVDRLGSRMSFPDLRQRFQDADRDPLQSLEEEEGGDEEPPSQLELLRRAERRAMLEKEAEFLGECKILREAMFSNTLEKLEKSIEQARSRKSAGFLPPPRHNPWSPRHMTSFDDTASSGRGTPPLKRR